MCALQDEGPSRGPRAKRGCGGRRWLVHWRVSGEDGHFYGETAAGIAQATCEKGGEIGGAAAGEDSDLQVVFHSILAEEAGAFTISDVIESVHTKMVRRHPHVFGSVTAKTSREVLKNWEQIKREERAEEGSAAEESILAGVSRSLPGVLEAYQLTRSAARIGFDWENLAGILEKLDEEKRELSALMPAERAGLKPAPTKEESAHRLEEEVGDVLFTGVNIARFLGVDPEIALKAANRKFKRRFQWMESAAARQGAPFADLRRERMEELWNESKAHEAAAKAR